MDNYETLRANYIKRMSNYYYRKIKDGLFDESDLDGLEKDLLDSHSYTNDDYCNQLKKDVYLAIRHARYVQKMFAKKYGCDYDEIAFNKVTYIKSDEDNKYKVALGSIDYSLSSVVSTGPLKLVLGNANLNSSSLESLRELEEVRGSVFLKDRNGKGGESLTNFGNLKYIGRTLVLPDHTPLDDLKGLEFVGLSIVFNKNSHVRLDSLKYVGGELKNVYEEQGEILKDKMIVKGDKVYFENEIEGIYE